MTTKTPTLTLKTALSDAAPLKPLLEGAIQLPGASLAREQVNILAAFRSMCRTLNYDVCEMAVVTYFCARHYGIEMTAVPVFPLNNLIGRLGPGTFVVNANAGIKTPRDLEGKRVGVRSYTFTPGTWARSVLWQHYGVDLEKVRWVLNDEEHTNQYHRDTPKNVERLSADHDLGKMLSAGDIQGGLLLRSPEPNIQPAFADWQAKATEAFLAAGITPVDHLVVIKNATLKEHPWLLGAVYDAIKQSKAAWRAATPEAPPADDMLADPMPMGLNKIRKTLETLMRHSVAQHMFPKPLDIDELFPGNLN